MRTVCLFALLLAVAALGRLSAAEVALVRASFPADAPASRQREADRFLGSVRDRLVSLGISAQSLSASEVDAEALRPYDLVILPYNPEPGAALLDAVSAYVSSGGRIGVFYSAEPRLLRQVGLSGASYAGSAELPSLRSIRFDTDALPGAPASMVQRSWNIHQPTLAPDGGAEIVGWWVAEDGRDTKRPAVTVHPSGFFVGHVYLDQEPEAGSRFFLALLGRLFPEVWQAAVERRLEAVGRIGGMDGLDTLAASFAADTSPAARQALVSARRDMVRAQAALEAENYSAAYAAAEEAAAAANDAYLRSRRSRTGELRGAWIHSAYGIGDWGWDRTIKALSDHGFNAIFVNMLWGAVADYPSTVLPVHPKVAEKGDQVALCLEACRRYGVELHVWKVNWNMGHHTPTEVRKQFQDAGRTQVNLQGTPNFFLAPHIEDNFRMERDSMLEVVRNYPVDGIHFDYIRYPGAESDFSDSARQAFEKWLGRRVDTWPDDCVAGGTLRAEYNRWRRGNITRLVKAVYTEAHRIRPGIQVSAAVFGSWDTSPDTIAQATEEWLDQGWLDFVCPMNYTNSSASLRRLLQRQVPAVGGRIPLYCGLGSWRHDGPAQTADQIEMTRRLGADGFVCFSHNPRFVESFLPGLALGSTSGSAGVLPHHSVQLRFDLRTGRKKLDGAFRLRDRISVEIAAPRDAHSFDPLITLARDGYECAGSRTLAVGRRRRGVRCVVTPSEPGLYRIEVRGEWRRRGGQGAEQLLDRSPLIEVLSDKEAAERELRNSPPRFAGRGIRVGVWQNSGYGSAPILASLQRADGVDAAPLYNLASESLAACQVVVLTQPREKIHLFKDPAAMGAVTEYIRRGGGVFVTHALVGIRGFVTLAPGVAAGGGRLAGSRWRAIGGHELAEGLGSKPHESTFGDRISVVPGDSGTPIAEVEDGTPVVAAGGLGKGRYVACGLGIGIGRGDGDTDVSRPEETLLLNAVRWLAGDK